jgi:hypothetical protein
MVDVPALCHRSADDSDQPLVVAILWLLDEPSVAIVVRCCNSTVFWLEQTNSNRCALYRQMIALQCFGFFVIEDFYFYWVHRYVYDAAMALLCQASRTDQHVLVGCVDACVCDTM